MDHFPVMNMLHTQADLSEPVKNLVLREWPPSLRFNPTLQVTTITVIHDDAKLAFLSLENFNEGDNIWMAERFQKSSLLKRLFLLSF